MITNFLLVLACVLLFLSAFGVNAPKVQLGWLGLALWLLSIVLKQVGV
jgi:hypothetical protein